MTLGRGGGRAEPRGLGLVLASAGDVRKRLAPRPPSSPQEKMPRTAALTNARCWG